jgi:flagellar export protein FliJ
MFRFRLDKVLRHRRRLVDAAARDLAEATATMNAAQARVAETAERIADFVEAAARARQTDLDPRRLVAERGYRDFLEAQKARHDADLAAAVDQREGARERLVAAHRDQQVLERLEERQRQAWEGEQARRERRQLDEVGAIRAAAGGRQDRPVPRA